MSPTPKKISFCQKVYAERERHISNEWNRVKNNPDKGGFPNIQDFKRKALFSKQIYEAYRQGGYYYNILKRDYADSNQIPDEQPCEEADSSPSGSGTDNGPCSKRTRIDNEPPEDNRRDSLFVEKHNHSDTTILILIFKKLFRNKVVQVVHRLRWRDQAPQQEEEIPLVPVSLG